MKQGMTLTEMAQEIQRMQEAKKDYVADTRHLSMEIVGEQQKVALHVEGHEYLDVDDHAHRQIAERVGVPVKYYRRMLSEAPELLADNVNHWFEEKPERRMVRTLDGSARAFLSERYRPLDNFDLANAVLPVLMEQPEMSIASCDVSPHRLHLKALFPKIVGEVRVNDVVQAGLVVSNNEVGAGGLSVSPLVYRLVCSNGMIADTALKRHHVGRAAQGEGAFELFRDETLEADDKAFWMKVQDTVRAAADESEFGRLVSLMAGAAENKIEADPVKVIERVATKFSLSDDERGGVLRHLVEGGDLSQYGLLNGITRASQDIEDYDRATTLERLGGIVLELPKAEWQHIAYS